MHISAPNVEKVDKIKKDIFNILHISILILALFLVISISIETFTNVGFQEGRSYLITQSWICVFFLSASFIEFLLEKNKWKYLRTHFIFILISIPYLYIIEQYKIPLNETASYFLKFIPLVRGGYALAIIVGRFTSSKVTSLFISYLTMLLATVYFSSLLFFSIEHKINPAVDNYIDSLWWAFMNVTTVGSNIYAVTVAGRILSIVLAALGMMMFPIFTVYITSIFQKVNNTEKENKKEQQNNAD